MRPRGQPGTQRGALARTSPGARGKATFRESCLGRRGGWGASTRPWAGGRTAGQQGRVQGLARRRPLPKPLQAPQDENQGTAQMCVIHVLLNQRALVRLLDFIKQFC